MEEPSKTPVMNERHLGNSSHGDTLHSPSQTMKALSLWSITMTGNGGIGLGSFCVTEPPNILLALLNRRTRVRMRMEMKMKMNFSGMTKSRRKKKKKKGVNGKRGLRGLALEGYTEFYADKYQ